MYEQENMTSLSKILFRVALPKEPHYWRVEEYINSSDLVYLAIGCVFSNGCIREMSDFLDSLEIPEADLTFGDVENAVRLLLVYNENTFIDLFKKHFKRVEAVAHYGGPNEDEFVGSFSLND